VDRYRLLPLDGGRILESRNTAWLLVAAATLLPVGLAAFVRFGFLTGLAIAAGAAGALFGNAAWGNLVSVRRPSPRPFFSMESSDQAGGIVGAVISLAFWILPLLLTLFALQSGLPAVVVVNILWAALAGAAWRLLLKPSGTAFEREAETMRARLRG
jgi:hypothetical protein